MSKNIQESSLFNQWNTLSLQNRGVNQDSHPSAKADLSRKLVSQIEHANCLQVLICSNYSNLLLKQHEEYGNILDASVDSGGLDNFAEGALSLVEGKRNESKLWKTGLNSERKSNLDCVFDFIQMSKVNSNGGMSETDLTKYLQLEIKPDEINDGSSDNERVASNNRVSNFMGSDKAISCPGGVNLTTANTDYLSEANEKSMDQINRPNPTTASDQANTSNPKFSFKARGDRGSEKSIDSGDPAKGFFGNYRQTNPAVSEPSYPHSRATNYNDAASSANDFSGFQGGPRERNMLYPYNAKQNTNTNHNNFGQNNPTYKRQDINNGMKRTRDNANEDDDEGNQVPSCFKTAKEQLAIDSYKKNNRGRGGGPAPSTSGYGTNKRSLGTRRGPNSKFVPPVSNREDTDNGGSLVKKAGPNKSPAVGPDGEVIDERLKNIDTKMIELIMNEVMDIGPTIGWDDIAGLDFAKKTIKEIVVWPMLRPDIFTGLRGPPKGLLLFGPPGTGKTLIGKCIASQSKSTFFSISASSLTSKWVGEGEKMVRALFAVARVEQPAVIFIDEIDSLLSQRSDGEHEASRRIKTEFLVQLDGATTGEEDRILVVGATNRPQEIDEAARRRFVKRLYIPLPEGVARRKIVDNLMSTQSNHLTEADKDIICQNSDGYSGADMANLCREAALGPIRSIDFDDIGVIDADEVRPIVISDFQDALKQVRASVSDKDLDLYIDWNKQYGSFGMGE